MFVCPVPKISRVMMKWRRRTAQLGRFTLWRNGRRVINSADLLCVTPNGYRVTQLGYLLCGTTAAELNNPVSLIHAPGVTHSFQRQ